MKNIITISKGIYLKEDLKSKSKSFYLNKPFIKIDSNISNFIKIFSKENNECDLRVCVHKDLKSIHHDMIILHQKKNFYPPHISNFTSDTFIVLDGKLAIFVFNKDGGIIASTILKKNEMFRVPKSKFHCVLPLSKVSIFYEMRKGPFKKINTILLPWAPSHNSKKKDIEKYKMNLFKYLKKKNL